MEDHESEADHEDCMPCWSAETAQELATKQQYAQLVRYIDVHIANREREVVDYIHTRHAAAELHVPLLYFDARNWLKWTHGTVMSSALFQTAIQRALMLLMRTIQDVVAYEFAIRGLVEWEVVEQMHAKIVSWVHNHALPDEVLAAALSALNGPAFTALDVADLPSPVWVSAVKPRTLLWPNTIHFGDSDASQVYAAQGNPKVNTVRQAAATILVAYFRSSTASWSQFARVNISGLQKHIRSAVIRSLSHSTTYPRREGKL